MPKKYKPEFKQMVVAKYRELIATKKTSIDLEEITNIDDLAQAFEISTNSLYRWVNQNEDKIPVKPKKKNQITLALEGYESLTDFFAGDMEEELKHIEKQINEIASEKMKEELKKRATSIRKLGSLASDLQIPNYSNMPRNQLLLAIGNTFIKMSGLIRNRVN